MRDTILQLGRMSCKVTQHKVKETPAVFALRRAGRGCLRVVSRPDMRVGSSMRTGWWRRR